MSLINFDGKAASFVPGKEVPNKEPAISKFVVEKLYRVHRERIMKMVPMVDCHVDIPDFANDTSWKKISAQRQQQVIARENEEIYKRILKRENEQTALSKETKEHNKRVNEIRTHDKRLKDQERYRKMIKIQKENELLLQRIERARPEYTKKSIKEWYSHHISFKEGRRSDPTAGHIMRGMGDVLPSQLPPYSIGDDKSMSFWSSNDSMSTMSTHSKASLSTIGASQQSGSWSAYLSSKHSAHSNNSISKVPLSKGLSQSVDVLLIKKKKKRKNKLKPISMDLESAEPTQEHSVDYELLTSGEIEAIRFDNLLTKELLILVSKLNIPIPFEDIQADISICCNPAKDDSLLYIQAKCTNDKDPDIFIERIITVEKVEEILGNLSVTSIAQVVEFNDLKTLRKILLDVFNEMDKERKGYITFDDFFAIMDKFDLNVSPQQLRFVVSDADENEDGVIDIMEYIPLAVDVILTFGARNKAKVLINEESTLFAAEIYRNVSLEGIDALTHIVLAKIKELDPSNSGFIHINQFRKILNSLGSSGPTELEATYVCENLHKDVHKKVRYQNLNNVFHNAKLLSERINKLKDLKNEVLDTILNLCEQAEAALRQVSIRDDEIKTGHIPFRTFMKILTNFKDPSLSRLQVLVIMSEVESDRDVNYYDFIPFTTKAIELFFDPKALIQRAELIDQTDMSVEGLLSSSQQGLNVDVFEKHLKTLFKSSDVDHNETLEEQEFIRCLKSLDLGLDDNEIKAMMAKADIDGSKVIDFDEFLSFFKTNLPDMEKEKHIRLMKAAVHHKHGNQSSGMHISHQRGHRNTTQEFNKKDYSSHLETVFVLEDKEHTGLLEKSVVEKLINELDLNLSHFQLQVLLSELTTQEDNKVAYKQFIPVITDILHTYERNLALNEEMHKIEEEAHHKADRILRSTAFDIQHIVDFLKDRIRLVTETIDTPKQQHHSLQEILFNPHSGLSRLEANAMLDKLLPHDGNLRLRNLKMIPVSLPGHHSGGVSGSVILHKSIVLNADGTPNLEELAKSVNKPNPHAPVISSKKRRASGGSMKATRHKSTDFDSLTTVTEHSTNRNKSTKNHDRHYTDDNSDNHGHHDNHHGHHDNHHGHHDNHHGHHDNHHGHHDNHHGHHDNHHGHHNNNHGHHNNHHEFDFRSKGRDITLQDLTDYVVEVRKASIMRNLMNKVNKNDLDVEVLDLLIKAAKVEGIDSSSNYLPVRVCFQALERSKKFRLTRPQAMSIVSWADCYDSEHKNLNMAAFAKYAAGMIAKILGGELIEHRATALDEYHSQEAMDIMQNLTENELKDYYEEAFMYVDPGDGEIDINQFSQIIQLTPKVALESGEIAALIGACPHTRSNKIKWKDFINFSYNTILTICREREVGMRLMKNAVVDLKALIIGVEVDHPAVEEEMKPHNLEDDLRKLEKYRMLAARLVELVKIKYANDSFIISLPVDQISRRQTVRTPKSDSLLHLGIDATLGVTEIGRYMKLLPLRCTNGKVSISNDSSLGAFLRILTIDTNMANRIILVNIMTADGKFYAESCELPVQLPLAAAVDRETAEVFVEGLLDMLFIEVIDDDVYKLSVNIN